MDNSGYEPEVEIPTLEVSAFSEIEACVLDSFAEGGDGVYRPILVADSATELELTIDDAIRLRDFLNDAIKFLDGRKNGLM